MKRKYKQLIFLLLMFVFSPLLLVFISAIVIIEVIIWPLELLIYKKKYAFLGKFYPLSWYFNSIIIHTNSFLLENKYIFVYDNVNKAFIVNNRIVYFKTSNIKGIRNVYSQKKQYKFIRINKKEEIIQLRKEL